MRSMVGAIFQNQYRQFAKVVYQKGSMFGFTDFTTLENAKKSNVARIRLNSFGMRNLKLVSMGDEPEKIAVQHIEETTPTEASLNALKVADLRNLAENLGLSKEGRKADLIQTILASYTQEESE